MGVRVRRSGLSGRWSDLEKGRLGEKASFKTLVVVVVVNCYGVMSLCASLAKRYGNYVSRSIVIVYLWHYVSFSDSR